nr:transcription termination/antitermination NusG family protein [Pseudoxanthomonas sp.]
MPRWYCVHTKPRAEAQALEHLRRQGFECLLPRLQRAVLRSGRRQTVVEALFPRYLFLRADAEATSLAPVRSTKGAVGLVRTAGLPATVPHEFIERLQADANADGLITLPERRLLPGERVAITDGPLAGLQGIYSQAQGEQRALVLLELLGGAQSVVLPNYVLEPVGPAQAA